MDHLMDLLTSCVELLDSTRETYWSGVITTAIKDKKALGEKAFLKGILSWYGAMGSFDDLVISEYNDHHIKGRSEEDVNRELDQVRSAIYREVVSLLKV